MKATLIFVQLRSCISENYKQAVVKGKSIIIVGSTERSGAPLLLRRYDFY